MSTTRYYFRSDLSAGVTPAFHPSWNDTEDAVRLGLATAKGLYNTGVTGDTTVTAAILSGQAIGPADLPARIMSGSMRAVIRIQTSFGTFTPTYLRFVIKVVSADGTNVRGTLFAGVGTTMAPTGLTSRTVEGSLTPVVAQAGDRLVVEVGAHLTQSSGSSTNRGYTLGTPTPTGAADFAFTEGSTATNTPWIELVLDDPPNPPTGLALVDVTPVAASFTFTPPAAGAIPTDYEYRIDGGPPVSTGLDTDFTVTGLAPATAYTVEVRTIAATGASAWTAPLPFETDPAPDPDKRWWTHKLAAALGLDPVADQPIVEVRTYDHTTSSWTVDPDLSNGLTGYTITHGRRTSTARPEPMTATLGFATQRLPVTPAIATRLQVALSDAAATALGLTADEAVRFTGEVTDPTVDHAARRTSLVCVGRLARAMRRPVDGTSWPVEDDGARIPRILTAVDVQTGTIDAGTVDLATPDRPDVAGKLVDQVTASTLGVLVEQPHGDVDWHDAEHRRSAPVHLTLPASAVFRAVTWSQRLDTLVNDLDVTTATGHLVTVTDTESADPTRYGPWPASVDTILVDDLDAYALGIDIVGRRADPSWQLPDLTVDLLRTIPLADLPDALTLRLATLVELTGLPTGCPVPSKVYVEGWTETATPREWRLQANVSDPLISGAGIRWIDWPDTDAYQWQDLDPDLAWLDLARITDPADTL